MNVGLFSTMTSLAAPFIRAGLAEPLISSYTPAGSVIEWGGNPYRRNGGTAASLSDMQSIAGSVMATGLYRDVQASKLAGVVSPYYVLRLVTAVDRAALVDVFTDLEDAFSIADIEPAGQQFYVKSRPDTGQPGLVQPNAGNPPSSGATVRTQSSEPCPYPASAFCPCGEAFSLKALGCAPIGAADSGENAVDALARWLGITPTQAAVVGVFGTIAALVFIKRVI